MSTAVTGAELPQVNALATGQPPPSDAGPEILEAFLLDLPPGPYHSSDPDCMGSDIEVLDEAPAHMRKRKLLVDLVDSDEEDGDTDGGGLGGNARAGTSSAAAGARLTSGKTVVRSRRTNAILASPPRRRQRSGVVGRNAEVEADDTDTHGAGKRRKVLRRPGTVDLAEDGDDEPEAAQPGAAAGPTTPRRQPRPEPARQPTMSVMFDGDAEPMEVPLGWGGLGVIDLTTLGTPGPSTATAAKAGPAGLDLTRPSLSPEPASEAVDIADPPRNAFASYSGSGISGFTSGSRVVTSDSSAAPFTAFGQPGPPAVPKAEDLIPRLLEVLPDLCTDWALRILTRELAGRAADPVNKVLELAFAREGGYPLAQKATKAGDGTGQAEQGSGTFASATYRRDERKGVVYTEKSKALLLELLPMVPMPHIRLTFESTDSLLVPTYLALVAQSKTVVPPYQPLKIGRNKGKGKGRGLLYEEDPDLMHYRDTVADDEQDSPAGMAAGALAAVPGRQIYDLERRWLAEHIRKDLADSDAAKAKQLAHAETLANGGGIECGCCFGEEVVADMFQCSEGHLFCKECSTMNAETKLGEQKHIIACMDESSCKAPFPESELSRLLSIKSLELYHRLKQTNELESAEIDGLESCPRCPFSAIIENAEEKLFRCLAPDCRMVSCRKCKKDEHLPKTCEEMEAARIQDKRHAVEDAMSEALIRRCPKCEKPFVKESGCNKITCTKCHTISCYICRKVVKNGYAHFDQNPVDYRQPKQTARCILWDKNEAAADNAAVVVARDAAQALARQAAEAEGVVLGEADLHVPAPHDRGHRPGFVPIAQAPNPAVRAHMAAAALRAPIAPAPAPAPALRPVRPPLNGDVGIVNQADFGANYFAERAAARRPIHPVGAPPALPLRAAPPLLNAPLPGAAGAAPRHLRAPYNPETMEARMQAMRAALNMPDARPLPPPPIDDMVPIRDRIHALHAAAAALRAGGGGRGVVARGGGALARAKADAAALLGHPGAGGGL